MRERVILHSDLNNFYASVECFHQVHLRDKPVAVCGDADLRHGIVLAKNQLAKQYGIKTGEVIWEARQKCPQLVVVGANFASYMRFSKMAHAIYSDYTDQIEAFGIDECWLDVTGQDGERVANEIRERIKFEMGITASVGVSWNKIFAKLGSDLKKPDATTVISRDNYRSLIYPLPADNLLYVGKATKAKLAKCSIMTIGDIVAFGQSSLVKLLGKWGDYLYTYASGNDTSPVARFDEGSILKSVGNSTTTSRDLNTLDDVLIIITILAESVALRLREQNLKGYVVGVSVKDNSLETWGAQHKLDHPTFLSKQIIEAAMQLFSRYDFKIPIRSLGVRVADIVNADAPRQGFLFEDSERDTLVELAVDDIRRRFGHFSISRAVEYLDKTLSSIDPKTENTIFPKSYFK